MKKRKFIWGLILTLVCGLAIILWIIDMFNGNFGGTIDWVMFIFCLIGIIGGVERIIKNKKG